MTVSAATMFAVLAAGSADAKTRFPLDFKLKHSPAPPPFPFSASKPRIIIDFDMYFDIDDVGDTAIACGLSKNNEIVLIGACCNSTNLYSAPCQQALLTFSGFGSVPVGAYQGTGTYDNSSVYTQQVAAGFGFPGKTRADYPDTLTFYRTLLQQQPDKGVGIMLTGLFSNLAILWNDATARDLLFRKVAYFVISAGDYPVYAPGEFNIKNDIPAAVTWFSGQTQIPSYLLGLVAGSLVSMTVPSQWDNTNPYKFAFNLWGVSTRSAWGCVCLMWAARNTAMGFQVGIWGVNNVIDPVTGGNLISSISGLNCGDIETAGDITSRNVISAAINTLFLAGGVP